MPSATLDRTFAALADPTRRAIIARLPGGGAAVHERAAPPALSRPAIPPHLKVLERAALIPRIPDRQQRRCRLNAAGLSAATDWLEFYRRFWSESLDRLAAHLRETSPAQPKEKPHGKPRPNRP